MKFVGVHAMCDCARGSAVAFDDDIGKVTLRKFGVSILRSGWAGEMVVELWSGYFFRTSIFGWEAHSQDWLRYEIGVLVVIMGVHRQECRCY
jgi:hypothetical protein